MKHPVNLYFVQKPRGLIIIHGSWKVFPYVYHRAFLLYLHEQFAKKTIDEFVSNNFVCKILPTAIIFNRIFKCTYYFFFLIFLLQAWHRLFAARRCYKNFVDFSYSELSRNFFWLQYLLFFLDRCIWISLLVFVTEIILSIVYAYPKGKHLKLCLLRRCTGINYWMFSAITQIFVVISNSTFKDIDHTNFDRPNKICD